MSPAENKISLAIVEDHPIVIQGLKTVLTGMEMIGTVESFNTGAAFLAFIRKKKVQIVLMDIMLPDANGSDLCKEVKLIAPETCILALSNHAERSIIMQTLQNGANGYLLKNVPEEELTSCIRRALNGEIAFSKEVMAIIAQPTQNELKGSPRLTRREKQILQLIAEGKTSNLIAEELFLSPLTIETHRRNLMQKLEAKNVAEMIKMALERKLL